MDGESWYNIIKKIKTSEVVKVEKGYILSCFLQDLKEEELPSFCIFKTEEECKMFRNNYKPEVPQEVWENYSE